MSERYHMLALIEVVPRRYRGGRVGLWRCDCGTVKEIPFMRVRNGTAKSCGCLRTKHGALDTHEYRAWQAMRARVAAKSGPDFESYAARGIGVCSRWDEFTAFLADMGPKPGPEYSLGRRDNDLGYSPDNCRWETPLEQQRNTRASKVWSIHGQIFPSCRAAGKHFGVDPKTIRYWVETKEDCHAESRY
jgi:hypothetical protein